MMDDELIREVNEEVRRDKWRSFWRTFGNKVVGASVMLLLVTSGYVYFRNIEFAKQEEMTAKLLEGQAAFEQGDFAKAQEIFTPLSTEDATGTAALWLAHSLAAAGEYAKANDAYQQAQKGQSESLAGFATLLHAIRTQTLGSNPSAEDSASRMPFAFSFKELYVLQQSEGISEAEPYLMAIENDADAAPSMVERARLLRQNLAINGPSASGK